MNINERVKRFRRIPKAQQGQSFKSIARQNLASVKVDDYKLPDIDADIDTSSTPRPSTTSSSSTWAAMRADVGDALSTSTSSTSTTGTTTRTGSTTGPNGTGPRGYRNNNPLNLRISNNPWDGKIKDNTDGAFEQFETMAHGYRAAIKNIWTQMGRGNNTIRKLIGMWSPDSDPGNGAGTVDRYTRAVSQATGIDENQVLNPKDPTTMMKIIAAMAQVENGSAANMADIELGWKLAMGSTL